MILSERLLSTYIAILVEIRSKGKEIMKLFIFSNLLNKRIPKDC